LRAVADTASAAIGRGRVGAQSEDDNQRGARKKCAGAPPQLRLSRSRFCMHGT
jgi:hypothetical protein